MDSRLSSKKVKSFVIRMTDMSVANRGVDLGDGVAPNETANFTDPQQTSVQFEDNSVETVDDGVVPNVTVNFTDPQQWSEQFEDDSVDASDVSTVVSKPPSSVSPSPVTSSVIVASQPPVKQTEPVEPPFPVDFSSTENSLRTYIFLADKKGAAKVLSRPQLVGLAAGLTYPEELNPLVEPSNQRNEDPDVVAFKVWAPSHRDAVVTVCRTGDSAVRHLHWRGSQTRHCCRSFSHTRMPVLRYRPYRETDIATHTRAAVFTSEEQDSLIDQFTKDLENRALLQEIIKADANTVCCLS